MKFSSVESRDKSLDTLTFVDMVRKNTRSKKNQREWFFLRNLQLRKYTVWPLNEK